MSRSDKLYVRLHGLEASLRTLAVAELEAETTTGWSFLWRRRSSVYWGKSNISDREREFNQMEKEITMLRGKLGQEIPGPIISVLDWFAAQTDRDDWNEGGRIAAAKEALRRLGETS